MRDHALVPLLWHNELIERDTAPTGARHPASGWATVGRGALQSGADSIVVTGATVVRRLESFSGGIHVRSFVPMVGLLLFLAGCGSVATQGPPPGAVDPPDPTRSLFPSDAAVLSDEEIDRILRTKVEIPSPMRVALWYLEHRSLPLAYRSWYVRQGDPRKELRLRRGRSGASPRERSRDGRRLPSELPRPGTGHRTPLEGGRRALPVRLGPRLSGPRPVPEARIEPSVTMRRARTASRSARCSTCAPETIPFTSTASHGVTIPKQDSDWSLSEAVNRAELVAIEKAMNENVENLLAFLGGDSRP